jgi:hypothetical protein
MFQANTQRKGESGCGTVVLIAIVALVAFIIFKPEVIRTRMQVPVGVSVRYSLVGIGNVVVVRNNSEKVLQEVGVFGRNSGHNQSASYRIGTMRPGEVREVGWTEWSWRVDPNETITVVANDYLPIVFSSEQLGIR